MIFASPIKLHVIITSYVSLHISIVDFQINISRSHEVNEIRVIFNWTNLA